VRKDVGTDRSAPPTDHITPIIHPELSAAENPDQKLVMFCPRCFEEFYHFWTKRFNNKGSIIETCPHCGMVFPFERRYIKKYLDRVFEDGTKIVFADRRRP
jgi:hypothetical protein